uniref:Succinate dehydrogenase subunit 4 n=1 Tax=Herposiphonia versicolor TaxID=2007163 RepID=UPI0022FD80BF|nr:Succinate dehydrogenase subunit 4 [Herposiphonia versicolor]WAX04194.1 Succinate dehydrogenase subunit 4 [Herposiphonia versicolor]
MVFLFYRYYPVFFLFISFIIDNEFFLLILGFLFFHILYGLKTIILDYIHQFEISLISILFYRLILLLFFGFIIEIIF